jgi:hypothetical protein
MRRCGGVSIAAFSAVLVLVVANTPVYAAGSLVISEFRVRGPNGAQDEFVEIYNDSDSPHTVTALSGTGYGLAASDGVVRCSIPNGTVIPARGHWLCTGTTHLLIPGGNSNITVDIPDNAGIALFNNTTGGGSFTLANRFDAVGSTSEANALYKEGAGYPALTPFSINYSWLRDECGKGGAVNLLGPCTISTPKDTDNNAVDFYFVDTNGTSAGGGQRLGAPGQQNFTSPIQSNSTIQTLLFDGMVAASGAPNRVRDFTSDPANNSTFGTLLIRRRFVNNTGAPVTQLRFRVIDLDTFPAASGFADLRPRTSAAGSVLGVLDPSNCALHGVPLTPPCTIIVAGTTLEEPPAQPNGGGFNSTLRVNLASPLASGASINLHFLLGIQQTGNFRFYLNIEARP